ncbi:centrosome-associated protein 350 [Spea bombifrons]|uniref:centrosome-associated protein 350 n=1 Tax=Spea bombifrons TaxID=233779 RepID=UPI00234B9046|nr:centrosome-associated protein 350 [Spea bombifrons]
MAEKNAQRTHTLFPSHCPSHRKKGDAIGDLSVLWHVISDTDSALKDLQKKLDVFPMETDVLVMETKQPSFHLTRKVSRKDGRYQDLPNNQSSKSLQPRVSGRETSPRRPLHVTTLESNVKKTGHVAFREPLSSYREVSSSLFAGTGKTETRSSSGRAVGAPEEGDFDSTRSSAVDGTAVQFLNDQAAIDALKWRLQRPQRDVSEPAMQADYRPRKPSAPSFTPSSNRLEKLKQRQPDSKLERLKERIRRQWELSGENNAAVTPDNADCPKTNTNLTRKVTTAPPAPVYPGFNTPKTKIRTPDGKIWQEEEFHNLSALQQQSVSRPLQEDTGGTEKSHTKRTSRPVRKVTRVGGIVDPQSPERKSGQIITPHSWRDGQKLVNQILGPATKVSKKQKDRSPDKRENKLSTFTNRQSDKRPASSEKRVDTGRQRESRSLSRDRQTVKQNLSKEKHKDDQDRSSKSAGSGSHVDKLCPATSKMSHAPPDTNKQQADSLELKKQFLPLEIRAILDDLQLDSEIQVTKKKRSRSHSPAKTKLDKAHDPHQPPVSFKHRHYDPDKIREYIQHQQEQRKKKQTEQKQAQQKTEELKTKRLQELYQKQKEAVTKTKSATAAQQKVKLPKPTPSQCYAPSSRYPQETHPGLFGQAWLDITGHEKQVKPLYQPSGESDKENKGQERPLSASSSSELSLSEPLQPLLRTDLVDTYCLQPDKLHTTGLIPQSLSQVPGATGMPLQPHTLSKDLLHPGRAFEGKPTTSFRSNLDRIEALKATAISLSSRIENEAKKLVEASVTPQSAWGSDPYPKGQTKITSRKPDSPPERESTDDVFKDRIQKMLRTCESNFYQKVLPGANNLYKKSPEKYYPDAATTAGICEVEEEETKLTQEEQELDCHPIKHSEPSPSHNSSTSSISEGPLMIEESLSEGEEFHAQRGSLFHPVEAFINKEFCIGDTSLHNPLDEFRRGASNFQPLPSSNMESKDPLEELAKGSPHSVINVFIKSYQVLEKGVEGQSQNGLQELQPPCADTRVQDSVSYADDFTSPSISEISANTQKVLKLSADSSSSSIKEELPRSRSDAASYHSSGAQSTTSPSGSSSSQRSSKHRKGLRNRSPKVSQEHEYSSSGSENKYQRSRRSQRRERSIISDSDRTISNLSSHSIASLLSDAGNSSVSRHSSLQEMGVQVPSPPPPAATTALGSKVPAGVSVPGTMRFSPAALHQRMSAEINHLSAVDDTMQHLCFVERVHKVLQAEEDIIFRVKRLRAQQEQQEQDLFALKQEMEQKQESFGQEYQTSAKVIQDEAQLSSRNTSETSGSRTTNTIQEEIDRGYLSPTSSDVTVTLSVDQPKRPRHYESRKRGSRTASPLSPPSSSTSQSREHLYSEHNSPPTSIKEATISQSELEESISEMLPSPTSSILEEGSLSLRNKGPSSTGHINDEKVIEEQSFRTLLPSEAHRRDSMERQLSHPNESYKENIPGKEHSGPFSGGQDSFSRFTMEMVRQYMQEGEMRAAHQAALLRLREKALKDKTKAELALLEHQKRRLKDKGEDDKMPTLTKRQQGLLLKLQKEQAEIKRLQEVNKAAHRERQLILKQQEEIHRIQSSTQRLKEKLKCAESVQLELPSEGDIPPSPASTPVPSDAESRSQSPVSVSSSETSSIMQKLRKMHSHMDAKFLTKREQQLVQRRLHAQELLDWKKRLDEEEIEVRQIEKQALAAWDKQRVKTNSQGPDEAKDITEDHRSSEESPVPLSSPGGIKTSGSPPSDYVPSETIEHSTIAEEILEQSGDHSSISEELVPSSYSKESQTKSIKSPDSAKESPKSGRHQVHFTLQLHQLSHTWSEESLSITHSETTSDQSDTECRVRALREELRKRKSVVVNLKREQKRRQKEKLRAQEAILLKQLQSYDEYIQKAQAELSENHKPESSENHKPESSAKPIAKTAAVSREPALSDRFDGTPTCKTSNEHEHPLESIDLPDGSFNQVDCLDTKQVYAMQRVLDQSLHGPALFSSKDDVPSDHRSCPPRDGVSSSTQSSPVSTIKSEVPEEMLENQSRISVSPPPALKLNLRSQSPDGSLSHSHVSVSPPLVLNLNLRSQTPEGILSTNKYQSYADDFEAFSSVSPSGAETPCEEIEFSVVSDEGTAEHEEEHSGFKSSPRLLEIVATSQEPIVSHEIIDPLTDFKLGDRVLVSGVQPGTLRFKGETHFAEGVWAGVELDKSEGNNDGAHEGKRYFSCPFQHGLFAPPHKISHLEAESQTSHSPKGSAVVDDEGPLEHTGEFDTLDSTFDDVPAKEDTTLFETKPCIISEDGQNHAHKTESIQEQTTTLEENNTSLKTLLPETLDKEKQHQETDGVHVPEVNTLSENVLKVCLRETVTYLQNIRRQRAEKIQRNNQDILSSLNTNDVHRDTDDTQNDDLQPQMVSVFEPRYGQDLTELGPNRNLLTVLGEEPDWFDEDFGLSSFKIQKCQSEKDAPPEFSPEPSLVTPVPEPAPKPVLPIPQAEPLIVVSHTEPEVEQLLQVASDALWRWKHHGGDLQEIRAFFTQSVEDGQSTASCAYKSMLFDLALHIFNEICSPDPRGSYPLWKKPPRVSPLYARRVMDPHNMQEVKTFLTDEVLSLLSLKKSENHKTDWQRMMKFGRKKRDRVDHILVQELHEEEAQWVNYDDDELFVKMQLADGIFETLIRDTLQVLQQIQEKNHLALKV